MDGPNEKGNIAEAAIASAAVQLGVPVLRPQFEHGRYDLVFEVKDRFLRIQCKWAPREGDVIIVRLCGHRITTRGSVRTTYSADEIDAVVAYCQDLDECFWLPIDLVAGMRGIQLRLTAPMNGQRASINWADDYLLSGAIAQLGERLTGSQEVGGSSPPGSTQADPIHPGSVGANEFRARFGWYMERAAAGEEFYVTLWGKPYVRLFPASAQMPLGEGKARSGGPAGP